MPGGTKVYLNSFIYAEAPCCRMQACRNTCQRIDAKLDDPPQHPVLYRVHMYPRLFVYVVGGCGYILPPSFSCARPCVCSATSTPLRPSLSFLLSSSSLLQNPPKTTSWCINTEEEEEDPCQVHFVDDGAEAAAAAKTHLSSFVLALGGLRGEIPGIRLKALTARCAESSSVPFFTSHSRSYGQRGREGNFGEMSGKFSSPPSH